MGKAAAEVFILVDGAGADPVLDGDERGAAVFLEQHGHAVVQHEALHAGIGGFEDIHGILGHGQLLGDQQGGRSRRMEETIHGRKRYHRLDRGTMGVALLDALLDASSGSDRLPSPIKSPIRRSFEYGRQKSFAPLTFLQPYGRSH